MITSKNSSPTPPPVSPKKAGGVSTHNPTNSQVEHDCTRYEIGKGANRAVDVFEMESRATVAGFREWAKANRPALLWMERRARWYASRGRHFSMSLVWEECRYSHCADNGRCLFKMPNEYRALVTRWICDRNPDVAELVSRRRSRLDV